MGIMQRVIMVGAFPPPVHGMAVINKAMAGMLAERSRTVEIINVSSDTLTRGFGYHWIRMRRAAHALGRILLSGNTQSASVYMSVSGGFGQVYELLFVLAARMKRHRITMHHHSYAYLSHRKLVARLLFAASRPFTKHVVLSRGMMDRLQNLYGLSDIQVLSNAAFLPDASPPAPCSRPLISLGFLSNISGEKGIFDFISLVDACVESGLDVRGIVAGPFQDPQTESLVAPLLRERATINYVGPKYGDAKVDFFRTIDVLIFPTRYANEAEPVTIHESLMQGVPVIAYGRGAIPEILAGSHGVSIPPSQEFVPEALDALTQWRDMGEEYVGVRHEALAQFLKVRGEARQSLDELLECI